MNNEEENLIPATGAEPSINDVRTIKHEDVSMSNPELFIKGGTSYVPYDILSQHKVGICTAISRVQLRQKQTGKKYSPDFQYLLQKKFVDGGWYEGSSIFSAMKVAKNYGFLPIELFTHVTEQDRYLPYSQYIEKLKDISDSEIQRLLKLCVDKIAGYAYLDPNDSQKIAKAIFDSSAGILCRYNCGDTWWRPSWATKDINPLREPIPATSGHAVIVSAFDYTDGTMQEIPNTWGTMWNMEGRATVNWDNYKMTECWVDLETAPVITPYAFEKTLKVGMTSTDVGMLQQVLKKHGYFRHAFTNYFGSVTFHAVRDLQKKYDLIPDGIVGIETNKVLNSLL